MSAKGSEADGLCRSREGERRPVRTPDRPLPAAHNTIRPSLRFVSLDGVGNHLQFRFLLRPLGAAGVRGIVSAGLAPGIPTPLERAALETARDADVVIVQTSRAGSGRVALRRYLEEAGMVAADNLNPQKARILLMLALTKSQDIGEIRRIFATY